jgi:WD40 repeat protein
VESVCLSGDGRFALSGSTDKTVRLWEVETGRGLRTFVGHTEGVYSVGLSGDGRFALSGGLDGTVRLWEVETGRCLRTFEGHTVESMGLSGDGRFALGGTELWEVGTGRCLRTIKGHTNCVRSVGLSRDGRFALSGGWDRTVRLWEVETGRCLRTLEGHTEGVESVGLSGDGRFALSGGRDGTLRLWTLDWELEERDPADWDEGARPSLEMFLSAHTPYADTLPTDREPTEEEITLALTRRGQPVWTEEDFQQLLYTLGCAGYGWLRPEGVRRELAKMAAEWQGPPPIG